MTSTTVGHDPISTVPAARPPRLITTAAGLAFAALYVIGFTISATPDYSAPDDEWTTWFADSGNRSLQLVSLFALVAASLCFVVFLAGLVGCLGGLRSHEPWSLVLVGAGVVFATATAIAAVGLNQVSGAITFGGGADEYPIPNADVLRQAEQLGFGIGLVVGGWAAALTVLSASLVGLRTRGFPRWLAMAGFAVSGMLILSVFFMPLVLLVAWAIATALATRHLGTAAS